MSNNLIGNSSDSHFIGKITVGTSTVDTAGLIDLAVTSIKLADNAVTPAKIHDSVAGDGLQISGLDQSIEVAVDDSSIVIEDDVLQVAEGGITTDKILDSSVTNDKLDKSEIPWSGFAASDEDMDAGTFIIHNVSDPVDDLDAANKQYVDTKLSTGFSPTQTVWSGGGSNVYGSLLREDGQLFSWGLNGSWGQAGIGSRSSRVIFPSRVQIPYGQSVTLFSRGFQHSIAVVEDVDGNQFLYTWGRNLRGELGVGDTVSRTVPTLVDTSSLLEEGSSSSSSSSSVGAERIIKVIAPAYSEDLARCSYFLTDHGRMYACGYNAWGQCGDGTTTLRSSFVLVATPSSVTDFFIHDFWADNYNLYVMADGIVSSTPHLRAGFACGINNNGQLCDNTTVNRSTLVPMTTTEGGNPIIQGVEKFLSLNQYDNVLRTVYCIVENGNLYGAGHAGSNKIPGIVTSTTERLAEIQVDSPKKMVIDVCAAGGGDGSAIALTSLGTVYGWGGNTQRELGFAAAGSVSSPTRLYINGEAGNLMENVSIIYGVPSQKNANLYVVTSTGEFYSSGNGGNVSGLGRDPLNVGVASDNFFGLVTLPELVTSIDSCTDYTNNQGGITVFVITETGRCLNFGRNQHFQAGHPQIEIYQHIDTPTYLPTPGM